MFLNYISIEFLGYEGLFTNIFSILSLAEMGISSVITYQLYREIAQKNKTEIAKLMAIYKYIYRFIGVVVLIIGICLIPFLKIIIKEYSVNWNLVILIYALQLAGVLSTYFLAYRRVLFVASQIEYYCVKIDTLVITLGHLARISIIILTQNYIYYLIVTILQGFISNIIISIIYNKKFNYAIRTKITIQDMKKRNLFKDIRHFMVHKISYIIYGGVDNIVISILLGISTVGYFSNYILLKNQLWTLITKLLKPLQATIGNKIYSDAEFESKIKLFLSLDIFSFMLASYISITFFVLIQQFIVIWVGSKYILSLYFVIILSLNIYIQAVHEILYYYRSAFGEYNKDKIFMVMSSILNLTFSIILGRMFGLAGIMVGTFIGMLFIWHGRMRFVFQTYLKISYRQYIYKHVFWLILAIAEGGCLYNLLLLFNSENNLIVNFIMKFLICFICINGINILIFYRNENFDLLIKYAKQIIGIICSNFTST
jgi:O-antigen/teichoic acid export membrane protein